MQRQRVGGMFLADGTFRRYVLNVNVPGAKVFVPAEGQAIAFVRTRDMGLVAPHHQRVEPALARGSDDDRDAGTQLAAALVDLLREHGASAETLAVDNLGPATILGLWRAGLHVVDAEPILERTWTVKTPDEIAIYRVIGDQHAHAISAFRDAIRPGVTENELVGVVVSAWYEAGGEDIAQLNVCAGENMNPWRRWATERPVAEREFVGIDLHGRGINGLRGDASRTFFVGDRPTSEQRDLYRRAYGYLVGAIDAFRAGRSIAEVMRSVPRVPKAYEAQLHNYNVGHGIGLGNSGYPHMDPRREPIDDVLYPNQVLSVECYFGEEGNPEAVKLEEQIVVQNGPPEILGVIPFDERLLE